MTTRNRRRTGVTTIDIDDSTAQALTTLARDGVFPAHIPNRRAPRIRWCVSTFPRLLKQAQRAVELANANADAYDALVASLSAQQRADERHRAVKQRVENVCAQQADNAAKSVTDAARAQAARVDISI